MKNKNVFESLRKKQNNKDIIQKWKQDETQLDRKIVEHMKAAAEEEYIIANLSKYRRLLLDKSSTAMLIAELRNRGANVTRMRNNTFIVIKGDK